MALQYPSMSANVHKNCMYGTVRTDTLYQYGRVCLYPTVVAGWAGCTRSACETYHSISDSLFAFPGTQAARQPDSQTGQAGRALIVRTAIAGMADEVGDFHVWADWARGEEQSVLEDLAANILQGDDEAACLW